jgi:hypothetical protein
MTREGSPAPGAAPIGRVELAMREDGHELGAVVAEQVQQPVEGDCPAAGRHQAAVLADTLHRTTQRGSKRSAAKPSSVEVRDLAGSRG